MGAGANAGMDTRPSSSYPVMDGPGIGGEAGAPSGDASTGQGDGAPGASIDKADGRATTTVTFSAQGDYVLRAQANDVSGDGGNGFQCCWTNALVKVAVKP